jgi:hypothetical protein
LHVLDRPRGSAVDRGLIECGRTARVGLRCAPADLQLVKHLQRAAANTALVIHEQWVVPAAWGHYAVDVLRSPRARLIFV